MDYTTRTRAELLKLCKERGLSGAGSTEDLIERLEAQDAAQQPANDDFDPLADETDTEDDAEAEAEPAADDQGGAPDVEAEPAADAEAEAAPGEPEAASAEQGRPAGPDARVKDGPTGNVFRREFYVASDIDDTHHRHLILETHAAAAAAGYRTKGAPHAGHRVRFDADATGKRTAVYEVYVVRERSQGGQR